MFTKTRFSIVLLFAILLAACAPAAQKTPDAMLEKPMATEAMAEKPMETEAMAEKPMATEAMAEEPMATEAMMETPAAETMMDKGTPAPGEAMAEESGMMEMPAWFTAALTDVNSGETFSIADFKGKVVLVETMAVWCSTCLRQQQQVVNLHELLGEREDFISLGLDIDLNEDSAALKSFTAKNGFTWKYAVAPVEVGRELANLYGDQFLNPPSAPMLIIDRHGEVHPLPFGIKSAEDLLKALQPFLDGEM